MRERPSPPRMKQHPDLSVERAPDVCKRNGSAAGPCAWGPGLPWLSFGAFPRREWPLAALGGPCREPSFLVCTQRRVSIVWSWKPCYRFVGDHSLQGRGLLLLIKGASKGSGMDLPGSRATSQLEEPQLWVFQARGSPVDFCSRSV